MCKGSCEGGAWPGLGSRMSLMAGVPGLGEGVGSDAVGVALGVSFRVRVRVGSLREGSGSRGEPSRDRFRVDEAACLGGGDQGARGVHAS